MKNQALTALLGLIVLTGIGMKTDNRYEEEIRLWHQKRVDDLKKEDGWLNLAGLFWLREGRNTFGAKEGNDIIFPAEHSSPVLGAFILKDGKVSVETVAGTGVFQGDSPVQTLDIFPYPGKPVVLRHQSLRWFVIQRGDKYAVRLRDLESPYLKQFHGIERYPVHEDWRIKARFVPTAGKKITIVDITGRSYEQDSPGQLVFAIRGKEYTLDATGTKEHLHFVFADASNKHETYGGGRFLDAAGPGADGYTYIDFNKAYNPPCAFSPYATCPTPPKQNRLTAAVTAGEKRYGDH